MGTKPSYEELEEKVFQLEKSNAELKQEVHSSRYLHALLENTDDGIIIVDEKGMPVQFNTAYAKSVKDALGVKMEPGMHPHKLLKDPKDVSFWNRARERALKGERVRIEYKLTFNDSQTRYFDFSLCPIKTDGRLMGYTQISRDITARMMSQERLKEKEVLLDHSEKMASIGSFIWDLRTNDLVWSSNMYDIHGVQEEDYKDRLVEENRKFIHPEDRQAVVRQIEDMLSSKNIWQMKFRIIRPSGEERKIVSNGEFEFDEQGHPIKCIGIYQDVTETKQMETDLANRNAFIETILEKLPIGVAVTSLSTGVSSLVNKKFEEVYGWPKSEIPDLRSFFRKVYPETSYRRSVRQKVVDDVMSGDLSRMKWEDLSATTKNGEKRIISTLTIPIFDQDLIISTVINNTEHYMLMESLKENEERYKALFDRSIDGICIYDIDGNFVDGNQAYFRLTGYSKEELSSIAPISVIHSDSRGKFLKARTSLLEKGIEEQVGEYLMVHKSGEIKHVEFMRSLIYKDGSPYAIQSFIRDISLRKKIETELRKKVESLYQAENTAKLGYFEFNLQTNEYYRSQGLLRLLGFADEIQQSDFLSGRFVEFIHEDERQRVLQTSRNFLETHEPLDLEFRVVQKSGHVIRVHTVARMLFDHTNKPLLIIGTLQDITHQRALEEQLRHAQKMESIGTLAGGIAHDFNNLLSIILGNSELALGDIPEGYSSIEYISEIRKASLRGRNVVRQLLNFTQYIDELLIPIKIIPILNESIKLISSKITSNINIRQTITAANPVILADDTQIRQLFINVFTNAVEAIDEKGEIVISVENISKDNFPDKLIKDIPPENYICIRIKDTGKGIEPEFLNRIFDPYFTTKQVGAGSGLGLSVVHGIVKSHNGFINVESIPHQGTCFDIYFPSVAADVVEEKKEKQVPSEMPRGKERILYIDDEEPLVELGKNLLEKLGYEVECASDPKDALALIQSNPGRFDLIITDLSMPGMDGEELAKAVFKINPKIPVILSSGYAVHIEQLISKDSGIYSFLPKPIALKLMAQSVREALDAK